MLLEFRVRNFKSIRDEQALSFVAADSDDELAATHLAPTGLKSLPRAVRSAIVYGPNASGKSTVLYALNYMRMVVAESATVLKPGQTYNVKPFRLDESLAKAPSEFEMTFVFQGMRHQYAFAMTSERIVSESLSVYHSSKPTQWFSRALSDDGDSYLYEFSTYLTGKRKLWRDSTRPNALFLSTAAQLNSDLLSPIFNWIVNSMIYLSSGDVLPDSTTALLASEEGQRTVMNFLASADISIASVKAVPRKGFKNQLLIKLGGGISHSRHEEAELLFPVFEHTTPAGSATFELQEESEGTQRLFGLVAPMLDAIQNGRMLVIDELGSSFHTLIVRSLIAMFHDPTFNTKGAQLVASTHDTSLLDPDLFRRDQIWFTEKDSTQATHLYPLTDFSPRKREAWERGYLSGRYGAVPFLREWSYHPVGLPGAADNRSDISPATAD